MAEPTEPLAQRIAIWLDGQGYPLEMRVARALRAARLQVVQSDYYYDPESDRHREIDLTASTSQSRDDYYLRVTFVVECKMSRDKPWILFAGKSPGLANPARVFQRASNSLGRKLLHALSHDIVTQGIPLFGIHGLPGYGLTQAFSSGTDAAYAAAHGVAKATASIAAGFDHVSPPVLHLVLPIILIEGRLFVASLNEKGDITVTEADEGTLLWRNPLVDMPHTVIDVVTEAGLTAYIERAVPALTQFFAHSQQACSRLAAEAKKPGRLLRSPGIT